MKTTNFFRLVHRPRPSGLSIPDDRAGFTLIEVIVALMVFTVGVLGLAATTYWATRQTTLGDVTTDRTAALQTVIERLRATDYALVADGSHTEGAFEVDWSVATETRSKLITFVTTGPGMASGGGSGLPRLTGSVPDTFVYRIYP